MKTENKNGRWLLFGIPVIVLSYIAASAVLFPLPEVTAFKELNEQVEDDIEALTFHKEAVAVRKQNLKESRAQNDKMAIIEEKKELCQAKADAKRDKAYLKADKNALSALHKEQMKETALALKDQKCELRASKRQLKDDLRNDYTAYLVSDANRVEENQMRVNKTEAVLNKQRNDFNAEMAAIEARLDESKEAYASKDSPRKKNREGFGVKDKENKYDEQLASK